MLPKEPTDAMIENTTHFFRGLELGYSDIFSMRRHLEMSGCDLNGFPDWFMSAQPGEHLTKASKSIILWHMYLQAMESKC